MNLSKPFDNTQANREGWCLFNDGELQRLDEAEVFPSDLAALAYVKGCADMGSHYHNEALSRTNLQWLQQVWPGYQFKP